MHVARSLLLLRTGAISGIAFVLSCGDNLSVRADAAIDALKAPDAAPICDCPAAEPPLDLPIEAADVLAMARDLFERHRFLRALDFVERSFRDGVGLLSPPPALVDLRATLLLIAGHPGRARTVWTEAATSGAQKSVVARRLANAFLAEGRLSEAIDAYRASLSLDPAQSAARYGLAIGHLERRETEDFIRECRTALRSGDLLEGQAEFCREMAAHAEESSRVRPHVPAGGRDERR